jgi:hypothetical protein
MADQPSPNSAMVPASRETSVWDEATATADQVEGFELAADEVLDALVGIPHLITRVTFRPGIVRRMRDGSDKQFAYVSCEATVAPEERITLRRVNRARKASDLPPIEKLEDLPISPGEHLVYNDGSTGIYRQIVAYLHTHDYITAADEMVVAGKSGETTLDMPPGDWASVDRDRGETGETEDGFVTYEASVRLLCPRGIRISEYENDYNPDGSRTRYLA